MGAPVCVLTMSTTRFVKMYLQATSKEQRAKSNAASAGQNDQPASHAATQPGLPLQDEARSRGTAWHEQGAPRVGARVVDRAVDPEDRVAREVGVVLLPQVPGPHLGVGAARDVALCVGRTAPVGPVVFPALQEAETRVEPAADGRVRRCVEALVPFPHRVADVAGGGEEPWQHGVPKVGALRDGRGDEVAARGRQVVPAAAMRFRVSKGCTQSALPAGSVGPWARAQTVCTGGEQRWRRVPSADVVRTWCGRVRVSTLRGRLREATREERPPRWRAVSAARQHGSTAARRARVSTRGKCMGQGNRASGRRGPRVSSQRTPHLLAARPRPTAPCGSPRQQWGHRGCHVLQSEPRPGTWQGSGNTRSTAQVHTHALVRVVRIEPHTLARERIQGGRVGFRVVVAGVVPAEVVREGEHDVGLDVARAEAGHNVNAEHRRRHQHEPDESTRHHGLNWLLEGSRLVRGRGMR